MTKKEKLFNKYHLLACEKIEEFIRSYIDGNGQYTFTDLKVDVQEQVRIAMKCVQGVK